MGHYVYDFDRPFSSPDISNVAPRGFVYRQLNEISGRNENNIKSASFSIFSACSLYNSRYSDIFIFCTILETDKQLEGIIVGFSSLPTFYIVLLFLYCVRYWKRINMLKEV